MIVLILAAAIADLAACEVAVHGDLASAATACAPPTGKVDLWTKSDISSECEAALKAGQDAGKYGSRLPAGARNGLIREFDKRMTICKSPPEKPKTPTIDTVKIWD